MKELIIEIVLRNNTFGLTRIDLLESEFEISKSEKSDLLYAYEMGKVATLKPGGLDGIDEIIQNIRNHDENLILTCSIFLMNGRDLTLLSDLNCTKVIALFDEL